MAIKLVFAMVDAEQKLFLRGVVRMACPQKLPLHHCKRLFGTYLNSFTYSLDHATDTFLILGSKNDNATITVIRNIPTMLVVAREIPVVARMIEVMELEGQILSGML